MTEFNLFAEAVEARFRAISGGELYTVFTNTSLDEFYLEAFPAGTNEIFRERREFDCTCCRSFIRRIGNVVAIDAAGAIQTIWDVDVPEPFATVAAKLAAHVRMSVIDGLFRTDLPKAGARQTIELVNARTPDEPSTRTWNHFWADVPDKFVDKKADATRGQAFTNIGVFRRGMEEIRTDAIQTVLDLMAENTLYRGAEFQDQVKAFRDLHAAYPRHQGETGKAIWLWQNIGNRFGLLRNTAIGSLLVDLSEGQDLDHAVDSFGKKMDPLSYKRTTSLITPRMIEDAVAKLQELGLESAVERRFAKIGDVTVNNVLFVDNSVRGQMKGGIAGLLSDAVKPVTVDLTHATDISMDDFLAQVVPEVDSISVLVENSHLTNFMSVTAPAHDDAGQLFKWDNGFAWSYDGDAADSIKQRVKKAGGNIDAQLRVSLAWNNTDDLDLHILEPNIRVYFGEKVGRNGALDVDMNAPGTKHVRNPVENYAVPYGLRMQDGVYQFEVNCYTMRETADIGFTLEVEYGGKAQTFTYSKALRTKETIYALKMEVKDGLIVSLQANPALESKAASREKWGIKTETLVPVDTLMASPNHWDGMTIGNKHWFFILKGAHNPDPARGIYNEFLKSELEPHRKVFEVLGNKTKCPVVPEQLSGVGFSSTRGDQVKVVVKGKINRAFNIQF